jgi:hypothetical protein
VIELMRELIEKLLTGKSPRCFFRHHRCVKRHTSSPGRSRLMTNKGHRQSSPALGCPMPRRNHSTDSRKNINAVGLAPELNDVIDLQEIYALDADTSRSEGFDDGHQVCRRSRHLGQQRYRDRLYNVVAHGMRAPRRQRSRT